MGNDYKQWFIPVCTIQGDGHSYHTLYEYGMYLAAPANDNSNRISNRIDMDMNINRLVI